MKGGFIMSAQVRQASILSGRQLVLAVTIALHAAAISGLMAWQIAEVITRTSTDPIQLVDVNPDPLRAPPPDAPERPMIQTINNYMPLDAPDLVRIDDSEERPNTIAVTDEVVTGSAGSVIAESRPAPADTPLRYRAMRSSDDYYPPQAIRLEQQGVAIVRACVDASGALSSVPQVTSSSRSRLLDAAAVTWAREALQFTPATRGGAAVPACKEFRVNFTLH